jgi:WD40 repeat protein
LGAPQEVQSYHQQGGWIYDCAFGPQSKYVAVAEGTSQSVDKFGKSVRLWDLAQQRWHKEFAWTDALTSVAYSARQLAAGSEDGTALIWDLETGALRHRLKGHSGAVTGVSFSPDGASLATAGADGSLRWWNASTGLATRTAPGDSSPLTCVAFSPDGRFTAAAGADPEIRLWDAATGRETKRLRGHRTVVTSVVFSPDGKKIASADLDRVVRVWDVRAGREDGPGKEPIRLDGTRLEQKRKPWDRSRPPAPRLAFSPDGRRLASINAGQPLQLWDTDSHLEVLTLPVEQSTFQSVAFSPDGRWLVATAGAFMHVWDAGKADE